MTTRHVRGALLAPAMLLALAATAAAQTAVTSPEQQFGHPIGADYQLVNFQQMHEYWVELAGESDRMVLDTIGRSELGRPQIMAIITSPANHQNLERYREIAERLARAHGVSEEEARRLAEEGKAVVWIDGGLHATEVLGAQQLIQFVYDMLSRTDRETMRFLNDIVILAAHANPDGHDLVADWYMRADDPQDRSTRGLPVLYEHYAGHDNNRDFYFGALAETENMLRVQYREWYPQIIYNHHQSGPSGMVMFHPPFRGPPNHNIPPLMLTSIQQVGYAMNSRFVAEGKGGTGSQSVAGYSTWWNGGLRTTPYYHNSIGLLTETIGSPTPMEVPFVPRRHLSNSDKALPVEPGVWHFRQSIDYSQTANRAVLDYASRNRDILLFNIWRMGMDAIEKGRSDSWTTTAAEVETAERSVAGRGGREDWELLLRDPADRDARGYILPADQADFGTATKFVNALLKNGVEVHRATDAFEVNGKRYPAGSYVVRADQAYRPHVLDMFEPHDHPNDFAYPGGPPIRPYDLTGWTLTYQMGVEFDRILDGLDGPFEPIDWFADVPAGRLTGDANAAGYLFSHEANDAFVAVNRLLADGTDVYWLTEEVGAGGATHPAGTFYVPAGSGLRSTLESIAAETGVDFVGVRRSPAGEAMKLRPVRIGLWDRYGGSMPSGWTRLVLEDFEFPFRLVFPPELDRGNLREQFDVLIFPHGAIPESDRGGFRRGGVDEDFLRSIPEEYRDRVGETTVESTVPRILEFLEQGGTVVTIGSSASMAYHADLPVRNHLVDFEGNRLSPDEHFIPGSILEVKVEHTTPLAHGLGDRVDVLYDGTPVFRLGGGFGDDGDALRRIGWFDTDEPLRSGWAWGQEHLEGGTVFAEASIGQGSLFLFTPRMIFRAQPHGTFPFVFNAIYYGTAERTMLETQTAADAATN